MLTPVIALVSVVFAGVVVVAGVVVLAGVVVATGVAVLTGVAVVAAFVFAGVSGNETVEFVVVVGAFCVFNDGREL